MSICGYNKKIGDALMLLAEGMIDALLEKPDMPDIDYVLHREDEELDVMISSMRDHDDVRINMFLGLNLLARPLFRVARLKIASDPSLSLEDAIMDTTRSFIELLEATENHNKKMRSDGKDADPIREFAAELASYALTMSDSETSSQVAD